MKRIIFKRPDGGMSVVIPAPQAMLDGESEDDFVARIRDKDVPADATDVHIVEESAIPANRALRAAWRVVNGAVEVDAVVGAAIQAESDRKAGVDAAISSDATIASLKAMTAAEFDAWWAANVTNAAQAINVLKRISRVVLRKLL